MSVMWQTMQQNWWNLNHWNRDFYRHNQNEISWNLVTQGTDTPVDLDDIKAHLTIDDTTFDDQLTGYIMSATAYCERVTNRSCFGSTWDQFQHKFMLKNPIWFPVLNEVTLVNYYDASGTGQTLDDTKYHVQNLSESMSVLWFDLANPKPTTQWENPYAVQIRFTTQSCQLPEIKHAIRLIVGEWFTQRANVAELQLWPGNMISDKLLQPLKLGGYF